jgi:hypothetical protein
MKQKITAVVKKILSFHSKFKPNDVLIQYILYLYFYIYFMGHKRLER